MCCYRSNRSSRGCGCGCGGNGNASSGCGANCCWCNNGWAADCGAATLPVYPDCAVADAGSSIQRDYPVYVSMPAYMTRGSANLRAAVELNANGSGCPWAQG